ncbi:adenylate kinase 4, mitochondrial [Eucyclogobius newberryi]|uniref:adenylate kinase 4, mitochondrial n=1 Tax=Eucyclogobius newberryi TaxID=166745 RepID=UPI003B5A437B
MAKLFRAVIMGPPGSGKGTLSKRIAHNFGLQYLSCAQFLQETVAANETETGVLVKSYIDKRMLVPDHVVTRLMLPRLEQLSGHSWLLEGYPRTLGQARSLNELCQLDMVISLNIPFETLRERLSDKWVHPASGRVYNKTFNPPRVKGKDDITGEPLIQSDEDKEGALMVRLRHYKDVAKPVLDFYKSQDILHSFSGTDTDRIWPYMNSILSAKLLAQHSESPPTPTP